jgi:hypothetical protein
MLTKYEKNYQIHLEQIQEQHFIRIKKPTLNDAGGGVGALGYRGRGQASQIHPTQAMRGTIQIHTLRQVKGLFSII